MAGPRSVTDPPGCAVAELAVRALVVAASGLSDAGVRRVVGVLLARAAVDEGVADPWVGLVRQLAVEAGRAPRVAEYDATRVGVAGAVSGSALCRRYGGWDGVLRAALVIPAGRRGVGRVSGRVVRWYPDHRLVECVAACWLWLGHRPSAPEYARWRGVVLAGSGGRRVVGMDVPSVSTITLRLRWLDAVGLARPLVEEVWVR